VNKQSGGFTNAVVKEESESWEGELERRRKIRGEVLPHHRAEDQENIKRGAFLL